MAWLMDGDPALRWHVLRDLQDAPAAQVAAERRRVALEGAGAAILARQEANGTWAGRAWNRDGTSTMHALTLLRDLGLEPSAPEATAAIARVQAHVTWRDSGPDECARNSFFAGEVEPCINGQVAAAGAYFGADVEALIMRLVAEQLADGGWNCEAERGSVRGSFHTTICVLEALLEHERRVGERRDTRAARRRGEEYLLQRGLFRRLSTGEPLQHDRKDRTPSTGAIPFWQRFAFPCWWHYDILRALDYLRRAGHAPDPWCADAVTVLRSQRDASGRWQAQARYAGTLPTGEQPMEGVPSRWLTLKALRVLRWFDGPPHSGAGAPTVASSAR